MISWVVGHVYTGPQQIPGNHVRYSVCEVNKAANSVNTAKQKLYTKPTMYMYILKDYKLCRVHRGEIGQ